MPLQNVYYERKVGTSRPCYVCRRPTTTVLATLKTEDFLYTCEGHLSDVATPIATPPPGPSADDVRKIVEEYRARETRRNDAKEEKKDDKDDEKKKESGGLLSYLPSLPGFGQEEKKDSSSPKSPRSPAPVSPVNVPSSPAPPAHRKFALHRAIFSNRQAELARKEQAARAKEVSKNMPQAPRGSF
ncbi:DUF1742-domain-containing protein [Cutaneotrichosporon oleaginosum]|uniref:DUF1742-domain-containing protein n=1 Tax=Cutaneotrichosporon oleaginosum TaxID=879819 RepID=A0A0J1AUK3_9TREE|nr:DUF1742-domain-containing protein [Cutaneotrichosporon oleaginosum]KLT38954.1 DUF1742-domain-containing protein [Cutaneotrichosporon oleaginosum]TXT07602.1 hypothetical protein COLE_04526 [Cutaneotrichosporon oleaginosum]